MHLPYSNATGNSTICVLSDIWLYNVKEIHEEVAPVLNNAVTGSVLNNFTLNVANLPGDGCIVDTMCFMELKFLSHSSTYVSSSLSESHP